MKEFLGWKNVAGLESRKKLGIFLKGFYETRYVMLVCNVMYIFTSNKQYVGGSGPTKGQIKSEWIYEVIDFPN